MPEEKSKRTVQAVIKGEAPDLVLVLTKYELEQLIEKNIVVSGDTSQSAREKICAKLGIKSRLRGRGGSAVKELKEKHKMTPSQLARVVMDDPELLKKITAKQK